MNKLPEITEESFQNAKLKFCTPSRESLLWAYAMGLILIRQHTHTDDDENEGLELKVNSIVMQVTLKDVTLEGDADEEEWHSVPPACAGKFILTCGEHDYERQLKDLLGVPQPLKKGTRVRTKGAFGKKKRR